MISHRINHSILRHDESGQSTLEFAVVAMAIFAVIIGLGALFHVFSDGFGVERASKNAPYCIGADQEAMEYAFVF